MARELNPAERAFLEEPRFAVLATIAPEGMPQQSVVWYVIDGDEIVFNSRRGRRKDINIVRDARVSLCVADGYRYVAIHGQARVIADQATAQADILRLAIRYHGPEKGEQMAKTQFRNEERITYRVALDRVAAYGFDR